MSSRSASRDVPEASARRFVGSALLGELRSVDSVAVVGGSADDRLVVLDATFDAPPPRVLDQLPAAGEPPVDVVVVLGDARPPVDDVAAALAPDGTVYWEVDRRRHVSARPGRIRADLAAHGVHDLGTWLVRPSLRRPEAFIPVDTAAPLPWFIDHVYRAPGLLQRAVRRGARMLVGADGRRALAVSPFTVIVSRAGAAPSPSQPDSRLVIDHGGQRLITMSFVPGDSAPATVTKTPRPEAVERTHAESAWLDTVRGVLGSEAAHTVPQPLEPTTVNGIASTVETVLGGPTFAQRVATSWSNAARDLEHATDWLIGLHRASIDHPALAAGVAEIDPLRDWFGNPIAEYRDVFGDADDALLSQTRTSAVELFDTNPLEVVVEHGDFNIWNLISTPTGVGVFDWEHSRLGAPLEDLVQLCTHWHSNAGVRRPVLPDLDGFRAIFVERRRDTPSDQAVGRALDRYLDALDIDPGWLVPLTASNFVKVALRRHRYRRTRGYDGDPRHGNNAVAHLGALTGAI